MSGFDSFLGNQHLIERLKNDISHNTLSHAYIIEGAKGLGKSTLAKLICSAVSCQKGNPPCMSCIFCDKIQRGQSPDIITVEADRDRVQLGVDVIRRVREEAYFAPIELPRKFYIIPDARSMNIQAQNALLKILEEPPHHVMFLLLCENADYLLPTIRSRAPTLRLQPLSDFEIEKHLLSDSNFSEIDKDKIKVAIKLSGGSLGVAMKILSTEDNSQSTELYSKAEKYLYLLAHRKNAADELAFYEYATKLVTSKSRGEIGKLYSLMANAVRDMISVKLTKSPVTVFYTSAEKAEKIAAEFSIGNLMRLSTVFTDAATSADTNANINLSMIKTACAAVKRTK